VRYIVLAASKEVVYADDLQEHEAVWLSRGTSNSEMLLAAWAGNRYGNCQSKDMVCGTCGRCSATTVIVLCTVVESNSNEGR
jgi:hypothetical protein